MGSTQSYATSYHCVAFASVSYPVTAVFGVIPYIGSIIGILLGFYLMIIASVEVHKLEKKTSYIVFGILALLVVISNISSENASRRMASNAEKFSQQFQGLGKQMENFDEMSPEEAGRALGDFFKGFEQATKDSAKK